MDWTQRSSRNVAGELIAPTTAAYALAAIGLNIHFGLTGLLNMGQAGFMLLGAYGFAISTIAGLPLSGRRCSSRWRARSSSRSSSASRR